MIEAWRKNERQLRPKVTEAGLTLFQLTERYPHFKWLVPPTHPLRQRAGRT